MDLQAISTTIGRVRSSMPRRLVQLYLGLLLYGFSMALMIESGLGLDPWDVFHQGVASRTPLSIGIVTILVGAVVLLAWIPLRQRPGLGTVSNVIVIGLAVDASIWALAAPDPVTQADRAGGGAAAGRCGAGTVDDDSRNDEDEAGGVCPGYSSSGSVSGMS